MNRLLAQHEHEISTKAHENFPGLFKNAIHARNSYAKMRNQIFATLGATTIPQDLLDQAWQIKIEAKLQEAEQ